MHFIWFTLNRSWGGRNWNKKVSWRELFPHVRHCFTSLHHSLHPGFHFFTFFPTFTVLKTFGKSWGTLHYSSFYTCLVTWLERHCILSTYILFASIIRGKTTQTSWHILQSSVRVHFTIQKILGRQWIVTISISSGQFTTEWKRKQQRWRSDSNKWKSKKEREREDGKTMIECTCSDCKLILAMRFWLHLQLQRITVNVKLR